MDGDMCRSPRSTRDRAADRTPYDEEDGEHEDQEHKPHPSQVSMERFRGGLAGGVKGDESEVFLPGKELIPCQLEAEGFHHRAHARVGHGVVEGWFVFCLGGKAVCDDAFCPPPCLDGDMRVSLDVAIPICPGPPSSKDVFPFFEFVELDDGGATRG